MECAFIWCLIEFSQLQQLVGETDAMIKALNKLTGLGMLETQYIV
jgi:hypothetical protein